ncbi:MAG: cytochrome c nitrite reductase small subunit [Candidatus Tectomicrobia bacterium]|uniref:Cytochrome c nitrite reductase small subunit n=1 Tax=Tectimicrobiota bacterium TaxID=2528274 RepID=A0A932I1U5_UNCTE|nr:cytochrome c nitrite reductase small subunit [Candidatus Tectomicrobia bacterium]
MGQSGLFWAALLSAGLVGAATGTGAYVFLYAKGASYLTNDPAACANCHVMAEQYSGWLASSHRAVAVCNDCHTPPDLVGKYQTKMLNGWNHSVAFTTGRFHEPIQINARNLDVTERACRSCHQEIVNAIAHGQEGAPATDCVRCHRSVGHLH